MASRQQIVLISDLSGDEIVDGGRTVPWSYEGIQYEIDLTDKEAAGFDKAVAMYREHARRVGGRRSRGSSNGRVSASDVNTKAVRAWANATGVELSSRGRIPASIVEQYRAAGN